MNKNGNSQIRGTKENPFHLSIGQVVSRDENIAIIKKPSGLLTLPRETAYLNETYSETLRRGAQEEIGAEIEIIKFIGSLITSFRRDSQTDIEKTTLYFITRYISSTERTPEDDEIEDEIIWIDPIEATKELNGVGNAESEIIARTINDILT